MTIQESIERFAEQCAYEPVVENKSAFKRKGRFLVLGMGGSQLPAGLLRAWDDSLPIRQFRDYGLPKLAKEDLSDSLVIAVSYSGNTEETVSGLEAALDQGFLCAVVTVGGRLLELAKEHELPFVQLPNWGLQPRAASVLMVKALLKLMGQLRGLDEIADLAKTQASNFEAAGKELAAQCEGSVPLIYASRRNSALAMNWKIKLNETGKIPAFWHVLPELNHNEMTSFDVSPSAKKLVQPFRWIFLADDEDDARIMHRMDVLETLFRDRGLSVLRSPVVGPTRWHRIFASLLTADWFALHTAQVYGHEATEVPMVEEFKKLVSKK